MAPLQQHLFAPSPIPREILDGASDLVQPLREMARSFPDFECLIFYDRKGVEERVTVEALWRRSLDCAAAFEAAGVGPGSRAVIVQPTGVDLVAGYFGVLLRGACAGVLARPGNRFADIDHYTRHVSGILANAKPDLLFCSQNVAELFADAELRGAAVVLTSEDSPNGREPSERPALRPLDPATLQYSSGSTGRPKGVVLSHAAIVDNLQSIRCSLELGPEDVSVNWIPLYHDMGLIDATLLPLLSGLPSVLIPTMDFMRDPAVWLRAVHRYRATMSWAPNFAYQYCASRLRDRDVEGLDLSSWRIAIPSAEPILADTLRSFSDRFAGAGFSPAAPTPVYGLAENVTAVTAHPVGVEPRIERLDRSLLSSDQVARVTEGEGLDCVSCGTPLRGYEVEIRDAADEALPERHVGVIWVRSPALFSGYLEDPVATDRALVDGWLDTGDRGYVAEGHLFFVARDKDLIVVGGDKHAPQDIEVVLNEIPGVRPGCAVAFGLEAGRGTEDLVIVAEVQRELSQGERESLEAEIRARVQHATGLGARHIVLVAAGGVSKTTSGKLARSATRSRYASELGGEA